MKAVKIAKRLFFLLILLSLTGCMEKKEAVRTTVDEQVNVKSEIKEEETIPTDEELISVLKENVNSFRAKDLTAHMNTIHSQSPVYNKTEKDIIFLMGTYTFEIELIDAEVLEKNEQTAQVAYTQRMIKVDGPDFRNTEVTGIHKLRPENGKWKIVSTAVKQVKYLIEGS